MNIRCQLCGEIIVVDGDLDIGQHVRCPFCGGKFSYGERPVESISPRWRMVALVASFVAVLSLGFCFVFLSRDGKKKEVVQTEKLVEQREREKAQDVKLVQVKEIKDQQQQTRNELMTLVERIETSIKVIGEDRKRLNTEIDRISAECNFRAGAACAKKTPRLNQVELTAAILSSRLFKDVYSRYLKKDIGLVFADFKSLIKIQSASLSDIKEEDIEQVEETGKTFRERQFDELNQAIQARYKMLVSVRAAVKRLLRNCDLGSDVYDLNSITSQVAELSLAEAVSEGGLIGEDMFPFATTRVSQGEHQADTKGEDPMIESMQSGLKKTNAAVLQENSEEQESSRGVIRKSVQEEEKHVTIGFKTEEKPRARRARAKCKSPERCVEFADDGENFCSIHKCQSYGCKEHRATLTLPSWVNYIKQRQLSSTLKSDTFRKLPARYCKKHLCQRVVPQINDRKSGGIYDYWAELWRILEDDCVNYDFFFCSNERLAQGKYCLEHSCKVPTCNAPRWEYWNEKAASEVSTREIVSRSTRNTASFKGMTLICGETCKGHSAKDPATIKERTEDQKMTCGDRARTR